MDSFIQIIVHEKWQGVGGPLTDDIALFKLEKPVDFSVEKHLVPVCLANKSTNVDNIICSTSGWGRSNLSRPIPPEILQTIDLKITPNKVCHEEYKAIKNVTDGMICAGGQEAGKGICSGDSGGPLVCKLDNQWVQVGITSWTKPCAHLNFPTVYTRVGEYLDWINKNIAE